MFIKSADDLEAFIEHLDHDDKPMRIETEDGYYRIPSKLKYREKIIKALEDILEMIKEENE
ncbi:hypothetical protein CL621_01455 [archaeon]|nr:hypothetical protein [archaeon]|tara:strand:+ start:732 stop:914 length:183 start_codon:yes stop_codon:yes gene_type:complete